MIGNGSDDKLPDFPMPGHRLTFVVWIGCSAGRNRGLYAATVARNSSTSLRSFAVAFATSSEAVNIVSAELRV